MIAEHDFLLASLHEPLELEALSKLSALVREWDQLLDEALRLDVVPQVHRAVAGLAMAVPEEVRERLRVLFASGALHSLRLAEERRRVTALLTGAGIPVIPWKGPVLAEQLHGDVAQRSCVDLDLLVPPELAWQALVVLQADGYSPGFAVPERRWPALRRTVNHLALEHPHRQLVVELHWALFHPMQVFPVDLSECWTPLMGEGGAHEGRLDLAQMLPLLCAHGTLHCWEKLKWVVDIDRLVRGAGELDWESVIARAAEMGAVRCLLLGLVLARDLCGSSLPPAISARLAADPVAVRLAEEVGAYLFSPAPAPRSIMGEFRFMLRSRERLRDRLVLIVRQLFVPRQSDWQLFTPGSRCYCLFYLERPLRMAWKWLARPLLGSSGERPPGLRSLRSRR